MSKGVVAKRYASALFQLASEQNLLDQFEQELRTVKTVFTSNDDFLRYLTNPKVTLEKKKAILTEAFASVSDYIQHTLLILLERHRIEAVAEVASLFIERANEARGIAEATVYSVRPLGDGEKKALSNAFAKKVGKKSLVIHNVVKKEILGGLKIRIGNRIFDGSVSGKLERLERQLTR